MDWKKRRAVALYPMSLVFIALTFLVGPGLLYNNFTASGLAPAQVLGTAGVCGTFAPGVPVDVTCQGTVAAGCQAQPTQCTFSGNTASFLNSQSPFTQLIQGNLFSLFGSVNSNGNNNRGPFDPSGGGNYYHADCFLNKPGAAPSNNITQNAFAAVIVGCTQTDTNNANITTKANTVSFTNWNVNSTKFSTTLPQLHLFNLRNNATFAWLCNNMGYWYQTSQPTIGYSILGCDFYNTMAGYNPASTTGDYPYKTAIWSFLLAIPCSFPGTSGCKGSILSGVAYHMEAFIQPENWDTEFCVQAFNTASVQTVQWYQSQQCINMETWFTTPATKGGVAAGGNFNFGFLTPFLTILAGLILFLIGLGINIRAGGGIFGASTQFGAGVNGQGTKLAQILGISLIVYSFLYSQFSVWFTSGVLPNGFDGTLGIVSLTISGLFFGGIMWEATQGGAQG